MQVHEIENVLFRPQDLILPRETQQGEARRVRPSTRSSNNARVFKKRRAGLQGRRCPGEVTCEKLSYSRD